MADDVVGGLGGLPPGEDPEHIPQGDAHRTHGDAGGPKRRQQEDQPQKEEGGPLSPP